MLLMQWLTDLKKFIQRNNMIHFFTTEQGNLLIRLLLAHIVGDFILQTSSMVQNKKWFAPTMLLHVMIVFGLTWAFSGLWLLAIIIAVLHWLIDSIKVTLLKKYPAKDAALFAGDQLLHLLVIIAIWCWHYQLLSNCYNAFLSHFTNYKTSLFLLGYAFVIWPTGYIIKFALQKIAPLKGDGNVERGGRLIGQFERVIILTFVLLNQYDAIGFLIAGKGIIRFAQKDENLRSEYVLVGTMMSYAISIVTGALVNWLLSG